MNWLKRTSRRHRPEPTAGQDEADQALTEAREGLREIRKGEREILAAAEKLKRLGESNDFAARIKEALGGT